MSESPVTLGPRDVEVDRKNIDPIIHLFPNQERPDIVIRDLLKGLYLLHESHRIITKIDEHLKTNLHPETSTKFIAIKAQQKKTLAEATKYANDFYRKMQYK